MMNGSNSTGPIYTIGRLGLEDSRDTAKRHMSFSTSTMNSYIPPKHEQLLSVQSPVPLPAVLLEIGAKQNVEEIVVSKRLGPSTWRSHTNGAPQGSRIENVTGRSASDPTGAALCQPLY
jgi:hypothetical protein